MDAHRIEVFDRADDDAVIRLVADDFHFIFFPTQNRLFDQNFSRWRCIETALDDFEEFLAVISDAAAGAAERKAWADNGRQANHVECLRSFCKRVAHVALLALNFAQLPFGFQLVERLVEIIARILRLHFSALGFVTLAVFVLDFGRIGQSRFRCVEANLVHGFTEEGAVFCLVDGFCMCADHLNIVALKNAHAAERQCSVQRGLTAHGWQQCVRTFLGNDLSNDFRRNWFDIGRVRQIRIGHDRSWVGVDEDDAVAFLFQRFTGLRAGIIELASLADNNGARADNQDRFDICTFRHGGVFLVLSLPEKPARFTGGLAERNSVG